MSITSGISTSSSDSKVVFRRAIAGLGEVCFRPLDIGKDMRTIHSWVTQPYAVYWGMEGFEFKKTVAAHKELLERSDYDIFIGMLNDQMIFMTERYKASGDLIASYYDAQEGDFGMHLLVAPPEHRIPGFTWYVFSSVMDFMFSDARVQRVVVEPDVRNEKIHKLNRKAGFKYHGEIELPHKKAALAFCEPNDYKEAQKTNMVPKKKVAV